MTMTPEQRTAVGVRLKAGREAKKKQQQAAAPKPVVAVTPQVAVTGNLKPGGVPTADTLEQIARIVNTYHVAGLGKGKPYEVMMALAVRGWEIGIPPGEAIAGLYVSPEGTEAMTAELMRAQINRSGIGHIQPVETGEERCVVRAVRRDWDDVTVTFTLEDARRQGLLGQESWRTMPRQMLFARATSEASRLVFSDVLRGVSYVPEEIGVKAAPVGEGAGARGSAPVPPVLSPDAPVKAPTVPQEASTRPSPAERTPPAAEGPTNGGKHPERALSVPVKIPTPGDASNLREVMTAGITAEQIAMLQGMTGKTGGYPDWQEKQARARAYFAKWNLPVDLRYLTKDEADGLIAELSSTAVEEHGPAEKLLDAVIRKYELEEYRSQIVEAALSRFQVLTLGEMTADQGKILASQLAAMAQDKTVFPLLLAGMKQQEGVG